MKRLVKDASEMIDVQKELGITVEKGNLSFANIANAISVVQTELGITGTTAKEASSTIQGSLNMTKAAWQNVLIAMADEEADFEGVINDLVEGVSAFAENLIPRIEVALSGAAGLINKLAPVIISEVPGLISTVLPPLVSAVENIIESIGDALPQLLGVVGDVLGKQAIPLVSSLIEGILGMLPEILKTASTLIISLAQGLTEALPELLPAVAQTIENLVDALTSGDNLDLILAAALELVLGLGKGLADAIPTLVSAVTNIVEAINKFATNPENYALIIATALELILALGSGIISAIPSLLESVKIVILDIIANFRDADWSGMGTNIMESFKNGVSDAWERLKLYWTEIATWIKNFVIETWDKIVVFFKEGVPAFIEKVKQWFSEIPYNLGVMLGEFTRKLVDFATITIPEKVDEIVEWFATLPERIRTWLQEVIPKLIDWGIEFAEKAKEGATDAFNNIKTTLEELPSTIMTIGQDVVMGLWNGIKDKVDWLIEKIKGFAGDVIEGFKDGFDTHSPSRLTMLIGGDVGEGVGVGILDSLEGVNKDINRFKDGVITSFDDMAVKGSVTTSVNSSVDVQSHIFGLKIDELIYLLKSGNVTFDVGNTRELRRALTSG